MMGNSLLGFIEQCNLAWLGNPFGILQNSAINPILDLLNSSIFIRIIFF
jgi:hypothetical protein